MKPKSFLVISRFNEDVSWINNYENYYVIYNKGEQLDKKYNQLMVPNIGGNQRDIFEFIYSNYDNLPEFISFIQANPFDHCNQIKFKELINNESFTALECYDHLKEEGIYKKDIDGGYMEHNNNWYIPHMNQRYNQSCKYFSFDQFMNSIYENYTHIDWIRFAPGSQYLMTKKDCLSYSRNFWLYLMNELNRNNMTEGHIIERACWYIFKHFFNERSFLK